ncbi:hypothetical protein TNCT_669181 [Trichonephila clavata]|uniref:Uncharacterized protein n=1 Tax=Trichonephila clavata TaxID=2740835 RepID=A0A8X6J262_TRICU|nr:hypothetical protein TNCT_669181 [Trichonephila clavata]
MPHTFSSTSTRTPSSRCTREKPQDETAPARHRKHPSLIHKAFSPSKGRLKNGNIKIFAQYRLALNKQLSRYSALPALLPADFWCIFSPFPPQSWDNGGNVFLKLGTSTHEMESLEENLKLLLCYFSLKNCLMSVILSMV